MSTIDNSENFLVIQVDVSCHTKWLGKDVEDGTKWLRKHRARKNLAEQFIKILNQFDFKTYLWNGDGGIFFCKAEGKQTFDFIVCAIDELYSIFKNWKNDNKDLDTQMLDLRVSADLECIISEGEPSFWTSYNLNRFVKDEKTITIRGVAINQTIREKLNQELQDRFKNKQLIDRFNNVNFHIDSIHVYEENKECPSG